ncbi:adenylate cyclase, partial [Rhizophlyctis rosea]
MAEEHIAVRHFREYLRIKTVQPKPDYLGARDFLERYAKDLQLQFRTLEVRSKIASRSLTNIISRHTDVVPVSEDKWKHDPFAAEKLENGDIVARGSQDMKCVGIQYLEAIRILKQAGKKPKRTIHLTFVPDEEIGGQDGMRGFVQLKEFKDLNIAFALDEGLANEGKNYKAYYGERAPWWIRVKAIGQAGHGSRFLEPNATIRLINVINRLLAFREAEKQRLKYGRKEDGRMLTLGDVTTTNLTILNAGVQVNVVPEVAEAFFDIRIAPTVDLHDFKEQLEEWCSADG